MKIILNALLLLGATCVMAQQTPTTKGEYINYEYSGKKEKINLQLPKGTETKADGKFVINGKSFHIEEVDAKPYMEKAAARQDTIKSKRGKDIKTLAYFFPERSKMIENIGQTDVVTDSQMKTSKENEGISCWYSYKKSDNTLTTNLEGGKVIGDEIFIVVMDDKVTAKSVELKEQRNLIFEILDSAVAAPVKKAK